MKKGHDDKVTFKFKKENFGIKKGMKTTNIEGANKLKTFDHIVQT